MSAPPAIQRSPAKASQPMPGQMPAPATPVELERRLPVIDGYFKDRQLVPQNEIAALRSLIEQQLQPALSRYQVQVLSVLLQSYPQHTPAHVQEYLGALIEETREYGEVVLYQAAREIRRTRKFLPTIAEVREVCDLIVKQQHTRLLALRQMERDYAEAEKARLEREAEERAREADTAHLAAVYGDGAPTSETFEAAKEFLWRWGFGEGAINGMDKVSAWKEALFSDEGCQAAATICHEAAAWCRSYRAERSYLKPPPELEARLIRLYLEIESAQDEVNPWRGANG